MSFDPSLDTDLDKVRWKLGDTDTTDELVADATITALLTSEGSVLGAAIAAADSLAAKYARKVDYSNSKLSVSSSQRAAAFRRLADDLRRELASSGATGAWMGGQSKSEMESLREDTDKTQPVFSIGDDDFPGSATSGSRWDD